MNSRLKVNGDCRSMEPIKDSDFPLDVEFYEKDTMFSDSWDEENMSVSDDGASEESSAAEDNDVNEDSEFKDTYYMRLYYEDEVNTVVSDDAESEEPSSVEHSYDEDLELSEEITVFSNYEDIKSMDLRNGAASEDLSRAEDSDDEDLELYTIRYANPEDAECDITNGDIDRLDVKNEDLEFARGACELQIDELVCYNKDLEYLDLAATRCVGYRKWCQKVLFKYFHLKCPALTQDKIDTLCALVDLDETLNFPKLYDVLLDEQMARVEKMESVYLYSYKTHLFESLKSSNRKSKRRSILRFIRLKRLLDTFLDSDDYTILYREVCVKLISHLRKYFKDDSELIIYVLHNLCTVRKIQYSVFLDEETEHLEFLIGHALKQKYDFWLLYDDRNFPYLPHNILTTCMTKQLCQNTEILLKYGFPYVFARSAYQSLCQEVYEAPCWADAEEEEYYIPLLWDETETNTLLELSTGNFRNQMVLQVFLPYLQYPISDFMKVLTKWSRSIPDPYVTPQEMHDRLICYFKDWFKDDFKEICNAYADSMIYDDDHTVMTPRKLSHLSRCAVREQLKKNYQLPHGIHKLGMAKSIQDYLLLEW